MTRRQQSRELAQINTGLVRLLKYCLPHLGEKPVLATCGRLPATKNITYPVSLTNLPRCYRAYYYRLIYSHVTTSIPIGPEATPTQTSSAKIELETACLAILWKNVLLVFFQQTEAGRMQRQKTSILLFINREVIFQRISI